MRMMNCPNCGRLTGLKRLLGFGTFFMALLTFGFWLLAIPFYPLRSSAQTARPDTVDKPIHDAFEATKIIPVSCEVEDRMVSADVCRFFTNALYVKLGKQVTIRAFDDPDEDAARKGVLGAFGLSGKISFFMSQRLGTYVALRLVETGEPDAARLYVGGTAYDPNGPTPVQQSAKQALQSLCANSTDPACSAANNRGQESKASQQQDHYQLPVWSAKEGVGRDTGPTEADKTVAARQLAGDFAAYWYKVLKTDSQAPPAAATATRASAEEGNAKAQYNLGVSYERGQGIPQNYTQAVYWYQEAAQQGYAVAENNLAGMYLDGRGLPQDYTQALYWYRKAADQGLAAAQENLGDLYFLGKGVRQDYSKAVYWYLKAAEQGYGKAQYNLGNMYHYGRGVTQSYAEDYFWTSLAASATDNSGNLRPEDVQKWRGEAASHLTPAELSQVQERVRKWLEGHSAKTP
jgi:TPR repeat protein